MTMGRATAAILASCLLTLAATFVACGGGAERDPALPTAGASATAGATADAVPSSAAPDGPVTFSVLAGRDNGATDIEMFMPSEIQIREGDTIEWTAKGFEGHTISFGPPNRIQELLANYLLNDPDDPAQKMFNPEVAFATDTGHTFAGDGTFVNSGFFGVPAEAKYRLTFPRQGLYQYICLFHPFTMRGTIAVNPPGAPVDSPATVSARGASQLAQYQSLASRTLDEAASEPHSFATIGGNSVHRVSAGLTTPQGQVAAFVPPALDIRAGDTVVFATDDRDFHNITFSGSGDPPPGIGAKVDPATGRVNLVISKESAVGVDPPPGFDASTFFSSGSMYWPHLTWSVRFDKPGTYTYSCTIHVLAGMAGVIVVH